MQFLKINGLKFDSHKLQVSVSNQRLLPSLIYSPSLNKIILYYQGPNNYGQQSFSFNAEDFLYAYSQSRYKSSTPKSDYQSFQDIFFQDYPQANQYVRFVFNNFNINPTIIKRLSSRKSHSRLVLSPSNRSIVAHLGLSSAKFHSRLESSKNSLFKLSPDYQDELLRISHNMNQCVRLAADSFDLSYFENYLSFYKELRSLNHLSTHLSDKQISNLLLSFSDKVDKLQKLS